MAVFVKVNDYVEDLAHKVHNLGADTLTYALSNVAPAAETTNPLLDGNGILANVTEISYANLSARIPTISASAQTGGVYKLTLADLTLTASGAVATFQYIYLYNATPVGNNLIAHYAHTVPVTMANLETFLIDNDAANGVLTLT